MQVYRRTARVLAALALLAVCAGTLASCSDNQTGADPSESEEPSKPQPRPGGHIAYGLETDPNGLDPTKNAWDPSGIQLANALYDPLTTFDAEGEVQPYLAESLTPNSDYTEWDVKLRPGVVFTNGDPLNAEALIAFLTALQESIITGPATKMLTGLDKVDDLTVKVSVSRPWASLPALVSGQGGYVISEKQILDPEGHSKPIGTGPFMLRKWELDKKFELVKNPRYWRPGLPYLDSVDFVVVRDARERIDRLAQGSLDVTSVSAPWENQRLEEVAAGRSGNSRINIEVDEGDAEKTAIAFNTTKPPLNDVRVRQAIAYATDVQSIAAQNGWPTDKVAQGPFDPDSPYFSPANFPTYNPERAKALIQEYLSDPRVRPRPREISFQLLAPNDGTEMVNALAAQWAAVGIKARLEYVDLKDMVRLAVAGGYEAANLRYFAAADPDVLWHFFVDETIDEGFSLNFTRHASDEITEGMNQGRARPDEAGRKEAYAQAQRGLAEEMPYLWLLQWEWRVASAARVHDARNVTLPDGRPAMPLMSGTHRLTETWVDR